VCLNTKYFISRFPKQIVSIFRKHSKRTTTFIRNIYFLLQRYIEKEKHISETMENVIKEEEIIKTPNYSALYKARGRPKMKPEDKKPRKRKSSKQQQTIEKQQEEPNEDLVHKLEILKEQWNSYYKRNRERILKRKKELREAKEKLCNETLGMQKMERRGRKPKGIDKGFAFGNEITSAKGMKNKEKFILHLLWSVQSVTNKTIFLNPYELWFLAQNVDF
jgi:hypothetical protein